MKEVIYCIGFHRGRVVKEDRLVETSASIALITNQRFFLMPTSGNKPVTIPLDKLHFYRHSENALDVYEEGRKMGYFFMIMSGDAEIFGICLGALEQKNDLCND